LEPWALAVVAVAAFATAILSGIIGMAGGIVLLSVMLLFFDPLLAIPLHGAVQLVANGSRTWIQRRHVDWSIVLPYALLLLPTGFVGLAVLRAMSPEMARAVIGLFVLVATWTPGWLLIGTHPERLARGRRFFVLGGVVGTLNTTIGATGPLIAPFFLGLGLDRRALVGTKAACQMLGHLAKLAVFGFAGFDYLDWTLPLSLLCFAVVAGTWVGSQILGRVSETTFVRLYKGVLTAVALRLVLVDGAAALGLR
jgi:uncharacterized membrane protein YfcA